MKLTHISIQNVAGVASAEVPTRAPIVIVAGANGQGKSSLAQAVRMALTGDTTARGITLKKELGGLVHDGAKAGTVELRASGLPTLYALVPSGKTTPPADYVPHAAMPFVTSPELFAQLAPNERRAFLFSLMGLSAGGPAVVERLLAKGCDRAKIDRVLPLLRSGFDAASKEAKAQATSSKGAWRAVTGEQYGAVKAESWKATAPAVAPGEPTDPAKLKACEAALESWQQQVGKLQAEQLRRAELANRLPALDEQAGRIERIERKLTTDKATLAEMTARLSALAASATGLRVGLVHDLARSLSDSLGILTIPFGGMTEAQREVLRDANAALDAYTNEHGLVGTGTGDPEAAAAMPALRQSVELLARAIGNDNRDLGAAQRAQAQADEIRAELSKQLADLVGLAEARAQVETLKTERAGLLKAIDSAAAVKRAADEARAKTAQAAQHHADVIAWDAIGDALAPDGIPGEMLAEALGPFNDRLAKSCEISEWRLVSVKPDMSITYGQNNRPHALLSESEKWRADAMLAESISHLSGLKLLVLDRFDVLDLRGRADLIAWLDILASDGEIDTALLCGTLKALPTGMPETVSAYWIEGGRVGSPAAPAVCDPVQVDDSSKSAPTSMLEKINIPQEEVAAEPSGEPAAVTVTEQTVVSGSSATGSTVSGTTHDQQETAAAPRGEPLQGDLLSMPAETTASHAPGRPTAEAAAETVAPARTAVESLRTAASAVAARPASTAARKPHSEIRYRNPATGECWSGRGLKPKWLAAALEAGRALAEFEATGMTA